MARTDLFPHRAGSRPRAALLLALALPLLVSAAATADDTDLFTTRVPPNVMFMMDNSGSMNTVVYHPSFLPDAVYDPITCPYDASLQPGDADFGKCLQYPLCPLVYGEAGFDGGSGDTWSNTGEETFQTLDGRTGITKCGNTRDVFIDPSVRSAGDRTRWTLKYLQWYFSENVEVDDDGDGNTILQEILSTNNGTTSQCLLNQDPTKPATYAKYRRSRIAAGKEILRDVICQTSTVADLRYGLTVFYTSSDPMGGYVRVPIDDYTATHANLLESSINALAGEAWTPLGETLYNVYRYFQSRTSTRTALGKDGSTRFPVYNIRTDGSTSTTSIPPSPVTDDCQQHFVIVITDGEPTRDDFDSMNLSTFDNNLIGHYNDPGDADETPPNIALAPVFDASSCGGDCEIGLYLDDIAKFMTEHDFQLDPAFPGTQTIATYTVGFSTSGVANAFLQRTAAAGDGEFYSSNSPEQLATALTDAINSIVARTKSFTSAAVPASRTTNGDSFYSAYFLPVEDTPFWKGHLKNFDFSAAGDILTPDGHCAVGVDPNALPPCSSLGALRTSADAFWDAATEMPAPYSRKLYMETGGNSMFSLPNAFTMPANPADAVAAFGIVDGVDKFDPPYDTLSPNNPPDIAQAIFDTFRGCQFGLSPCVPRLDSNNDPEYLGDIFHSNPVVVGSPNSPINEASYKSFATTYRTRTRVIYAGANGGFMHGFNAGSWRTTEPDGITPLVPPRHDRGTGEELFGFMPWTVRNKAKDILKFVSGLRTEVSVDGSPSVADVWFYRNVSGSNLTTVNPLIVNKQEEQWRTVLIAGLRQGGDEYFALDVTDPTTSASDSTTTYPRYLWGFPCDDCANATNPGTAGAATYLGETWSDPVITRVRVKAQGGTDPRGYERWVAIFGGGYHEHGDPNGPNYLVPGDAGFTPQGRALYMVDITTGEILAEKHFDPSATSLASATGEQVGIREMRYAIASAPAVFDLDFDGFADVVYVGDLGGNIWKWVIKAPGQDPINNSSVDDDPAQPDWPFRIFFRGGTSLEPALPGEQTGGTYDPSVHYQSFFYPPTGVLRQGRLILAFGAGERANPIVPVSEYNDGDPSNNNHYYVVKDSDPMQRYAPVTYPLPAAFDESDLADFDAPTPLDCDAMKATKQGYFITARDAEAFVSNSIIFLGTVFTGSFLQADPSASACDGAGTSVLYAFDLECGVGKFPSNPGTDADKRRVAIGTGLPTRPRVSVGDLNQGGGGGGCTNRVVVVTSDGEIWNDCPGSIPSSGVRVRSWRER